ncbi:MAG: hypothetical protein A3B99_02505 [Candidatus Yanofskybacteria bacterium RIFCSPHIGHO2_02_FULL_44_12b]|uniref:Uncharacterized protein n=2 Tax=Candidatus Yanofskyibacteriota TaxID=1752733 RepID=A0A1F8GKP3_9BACT|nr:MAG: hypothetical protein UW79_C0029G0002 [Candidatus Yanofskybacteria bacterium GW2011_GWA2_44_9]OGN04008.1 MAG: hypothetical protein A2659_00130 [Candidatus Yanofskybacteria bacterium RIFCSPHIGHO2_01_FULL_44_24]OGN15340.1 MAG: hypothetical protein A3B99_02505 [Candidatus Yanofskybacteria bacterium RIFCSPHIGHO2_02_FULL_44_12b]OGN25965.1 MAG: hypothetical protein A2925_04510 [Candidatus Yanofskybacteria bacterium RIFCSPLOWO2_01_FULL_44_22]
MIKKLIVRLVTNFQPRMNLGEKRFHEKSAMESLTEKERYDATMERRVEQRGSKFVSERTTPTEGEIRGPSEKEPQE